MFAVSEKFLAAMEHQPYMARVTLDGIDTIQGDAIEQITFSGGDNNSTKSISLGTAVAASAEVTLQKALVDVPVAGREMFIELGLELDGEVEWVPMGRYTATDPTEDDGILTVPGLDALAAKFDREFEPIEGMNFEQAGGVDALELLQAMCARRDVTVDTTGLTTVALTFAPTGYTERRIIGMIAALSGKNAYMDRYGVLRFHWYEPVDVTISDDNYYEGGMEKASYGFAVKWLKCYVEPMEETLCEGDPTGEQGIFFECPWVTEEILAGLWQRLQGFTYTPTPNLSFQGDPRLDPGDVITMEDSYGNSARVPIMSITHEYDGGLLTRIAAQGQRKTESYEGPVMREVKRTTAQILKKANEIELSVKSLDESLEGDALIARINISEGLVKIQAQNIRLEGIVTANQNFRILTDGSMAAVNGTFAGRVEATSGIIGGCQIEDGVLKVGAANIVGPLVVGQLPENVALSSEIPTNLSQLLNDADYQNRSGVVTIIDGTVNADFVNALALKVKAANIEGVLAVGQLPENIALTSEIPTNLSQLLNDADYQNRSGVVTIIDGTVNADFVNALALKVKAA
ncbi:MAG: hypothetical protein IKY59_07560, partial [Oscillospiraceae bacterium]|nr:hypothetical protein [Oscillospiraceae bacterium]